MISRKSARLLAELMSLIFRDYHSSHGGRGYYTVDTRHLYDFLFDNGYPAWFCNVAQRTWTSSDTHRLKDFIMKLHTGESQYDETQNWSWEQREKLGQQYLTELAEDSLSFQSKLPPSAFKPDPQVEQAKFLRSSLELDGYTLKDGKLLSPETEMLDTADQVGVLESLYSSLGLSEMDTAVHHLKLSEEHYIAERWDDSISNSRKFLECVLREVAVLYSVRVKGVSLPESAYSKPVQVRDYLMKEGLIESRERDAIGSVYGLLSETGSHPYMAQNEQARLLRHLALTFSEFAMLRLQGRLKARDNVAP